MTQLLNEYLLLKKLKPQVKFKYYGCRYEIVEVTCQHVVVRMIPDFNVSTYHIAKSRFIELVIKNVYVLDVSTN